MPGCQDKFNWNKTSHADWDRALLAIYGDARPDPGVEIDVELVDPVALNKNATNISNTLMREYATNINNIWNGPIYQQLRRYVVRYVLRINLRPISESNYWENKRQRAVDKAEQRKLESDSANERERGTLRSTFKLKPLRKRLQVAESDRRGADTVFCKSKSADKPSRTMLYKELQSTRADVQSIRKETITLDSRLRTVKKHRNYYNRLSKATTPTSTATPDERTPQTISRPTVGHPDLQDFVEAVCLDDLLARLSDVDRQLAPSGTDRGLVVISETVPSLWLTLGSLSNRYHALSGMRLFQFRPDISVDPTSQESKESEESEDSKMDVEESTIPTPGPPFASNTTLLPHQRKQALKSVKFPAPKQITSRQIYEVGGGREAARTREALLRRPENANIPRLHENIGKSSVLRAITFDEVDNAHAVRNGAAACL
ncbi:hypothetical protein BGX30_003744 [Mortierella sp. GBA39]|nr:hypothetical protein BGX30_003744 [Mortierella sp. GBA39]